MNSENSSKENDSVYNVSLDKNDESENEFDDEYVYNPNKKQIEKTYVEEESVFETYDKLINLKIGNYKVLPIIGIIIGFILIVFSLILFSNSSEKIIDNVASSELNVSVVILLTIGLLLMIISIVKLLNLSHPFSDIAKSIDSIDKEEKENDILLKDTEKDLKKEEESTKFKEKYSKLKDKFKKENITKLPNAKKSSAKNSTNDEYEKAKLETETIDDIFLDIDEK